jgi:hypothetical protein
VTFEWAMVALAAITAFTVYALVRGGDPRWRR